MKIIKSNILPLLKSIQVINEFLVAFIHKVLLSFVCMLIKILRELHNKCIIYESHIKVI